MVAAIMLKLWEVAIANGGGVCWGTKMVTVSRIGLVIISINYIMLTWLGNYYKIYVSRMKSLLVPVLSFLKYSELSFSKRALYRDYLCSGCFAKIASCYAAKSLLIWNSFLAANILLEEVSTLDDDVSMQL